MRTIHRMMVLLALGAGAGCLELPFARPTAASLDPKGPDVCPCEPVTAVQVNRANAWQKLKELTEELDREEREYPAPRGEDFSLEE